MVFFGILLQMCLFPLPGHSYVLYWAYGDVMFPFVKKMQLRRFQQIRSAALTNASICYFLKNPELKKKEGNRRHVYAAIANFLVEQGETYDWEEQFWSKDNDVDVFQPEYGSNYEGGGLEDDAMDDQLLRDLSVDHVTPVTGHGGVWTLAQTSSAVKSYFRFAIMRSGVRCFRFVIIRSGVRCKSW
jgi:hypothetical protein